MSDEKGIRLTILYSILHLLVDGVCAMAMFGEFIGREEGYFYILLYNFCAFALQMPFGVILDTVNTLKVKGRKGRPGNPDPAFLAAAMGVLCTVAGAVTHPVVLGIGNALFHVGGGVGTICEDRAADGRGIRLGIFVAPGALGLYLGSLIAAGSGQDGKGRLLWLFCTGVFMLLLLCAEMLYMQRHSLKLYGKGKPEKEGGDYYRLSRRQESVYKGNGRLDSRPVTGKLRLAACCFLVVILRSYIGMAVAFPWKTGALAGILGVLALVCGKMAGGFLGAWKGAFRTAAVSLAIGAFCYLFSAVMPVGLAALFLFNMTMPITLYWMVCAFPQMPGFAFGFLTFALFLGFLPGYFGLQPLWSGNVSGCMGSVLSLLLLAAGLGKGGRGDRLSD